jgi:hypothetical protein
MSRNDIGLYRNFNRNADYVHELIAQLIEEQNGDVDAYERE